MMNGILCVNKPQDFTSFDVVAKLRGILGMKRLGHAGTLDPMATGVLPVFVGNATKACDIMPDNFKSYRAGFKMGQTSDSQDITGKILTTSDKIISLDDIIEILPDFTGKIMQLPPMYSAVQVNGKRLYDFARQGIEVERQPREIEIRKLNIVEYDTTVQEGIMEIDCGKGTYIRTIIHDIGQKLGCGGIMTSLVRTYASGFTLNDCYTFEEIQQARDENNLESLILPIERIFNTLPKLRLNEHQTKLYKNGVKLNLEKIHNLIDCELYGLYGFDGMFIGTAIADFENGVLRIGKNLA